MPQPDGVLEPVDRPAHVPGPRDRRGRQLDPTPATPHLDGRARRRTATRRTSRSARPPTPGSTRSSRSPTSASTSSSTSAPARSATAPARSSASRCRAAPGRLPAAVRAAAAARRRRARAHARGAAARRRAGRRPASPGSTSRPRPAAPRRRRPGNGYREWDVTVAGRATMLAGGPSHGFVIRDSARGGRRGRRAVASARATRSPTRPRCRSSSCASTASGTPAPPPPAPSDDLEPTHVECGEVLTREHAACSTTSAARSATASSIGAPNIVVDLAGHTIDGPDYLLIGEEEDLPAGIRNIGHENVVIRNGIVQEFGNGVSLMAGARFGVVEDLSSSATRSPASSCGTPTTAATATTVRGNVFTMNTTGVAILGGTDNALVAGQRLQRRRRRRRSTCSTRPATGSSATRSSGVPIDPNFDSDAASCSRARPTTCVLGNTLAESGDGGVIVDVRLAPQPRREQRDDAHRRRRRRRRGVRRQRADRQHGAPRFRRGHRAERLQLRASCSTTTCASTRPASTCRGVERQR